MAKLCRLRFLLALCVLGCAFAGARGQTYTSVVIFGDSLCDTGNVANLTTAKYTAALRIPGIVADYTDGRFTDGIDTVPPAQLYRGVWVEQLAALFAAKPAVKDSLDGGTNYSYGFATTADGTTLYTFGPGNAFSVTVENMGQQITDYLATNPTINSKTLFVVWGGANDLINATSASDITNAAARDVALVQRLISAGATDIIVPNLPPLGLVPRFNGSTATSVPATQSALAFNQALAAGLAGVPAANPGKTLHLFPLDIATLFNVITSPSATEFTNVTASSQGNASVDPDDYLFWDDLHPTTAGHHLISLAAEALLSPITTTTTLSSSALSANLNQSVTFTASVTATAGSPTGSVVFQDGMTVLGTPSLTANGTPTSTATYTTSSLAAGPHSITATYSGTTGFAGSASAALSEIVTAPALSTSLSSTSLTVRSGSTGTVTLNLASTGGYSGTATFACGSLPPHVSCTFSPTSLTFTGSNSTQSSTLTVGTTALNALLAPLPSGEERSGGTGIALALGWMPLAGLCGLAGRRRGVTRRGFGLSLVLALLMLGGAMGMTGCAGASNQAVPGTYTVPVTVTTGGGASTVNLTLVVQ